MNTEAPGTCFVIMPFKSPFNECYAKVIRPAIRLAGLKPLRADELLGSRLVLTDIWQSINSAEVVIAELTGQNPNVLYELGLSHAIGKPTIIIAHTIDNIPSDLRGLRSVFYNISDPDWARDLRRKLKEHLKETRTSGGDRSLALPRGDQDNVVAYSYNLFNYGMGYESQRITCMIQEDGSAVTVRELTLLASSEVDSIEHYMMLPETPPDSKQSALKAYEIEAIDPGRRVEKVETHLPGGKLAIRLIISPPLEPGERYRYRFQTSTLKRLFSLHGEPVRIPFDYFAWDISRPTGMLSMAVQFPEGKRAVNVEHDVWFAVDVSQARSDKEYERVAAAGLLRQEAHDGSTLLKMDVPYPILGLTYVIKWIPPGNPRVLPSV
jgi:hypothetical protein